MVGIRRLDPDAVLAAVRQCFDYAPGEGRATGYLYGDVDWPAPFVELGPQLLDEFPATLVVFQAYRDGDAWCDWHADAMGQTIVSLGATRLFLTDTASWSLAHGDVIVLEPGVPHCVPADPVVSGERVSLVFR